MIGRVGSRTKVAYWLHQGTPAHDIRPRRPGGMLRFYWNRVGRVVHFKRVRHPGIGGTPYLTSAMRDGCLGFIVTEIESGGAASFTD